jgi:phage-related minor tail protein
VVSSEGGIIETFKKFFGIVGDGAANRAQMFEDLEKNLEAIGKRTTALAEATKVVQTVEVNGQKTRQDLNLVTEQLTERNKELVDVYNKTRPAVDLLNDELANAERLYQSNNISLDQYLTLLEQANEKYESSVQKTAIAKTGLQQYADAARNLGNQLDSVAVRSLQGLEDALTGVFMGTMTVKDAFKSMASSIISDLIRIYIQRTITGPIADALFGPLQTAGVSARAMGGPVSVNRPYLVGEKGPELFVPNSSGSIVSNNKLAGGGGDTVVVNQTINLSAGVSQTVRAEVMNMMPRIMDATKSAVADAKRRGGTFAKAFA